MNTLLFENIFVFHITYILEYEVVLFLNIWCNHNYTGLFISFEEIIVLPSGVKTILNKICSAVTRSFMCVIEKKTQQFF